MIVLKHGETFCNKSYIYLFPLFKSLYRIQLPTIFRNKIKIAAIGIKDYLQPSFNNHIFICIDVLTTGRNNMEDILSNIQGFSLYETDYAIYDNYHMIVLKAEKKLLEALNKFKESKYSEMLDDINPKIIYENKEICNILLKTPQAKKNFIEIIKGKYNIDDETIDEIVLNEYDFKIDESENFN